MTVDTDAIIKLDNQLRALRQELQDIRTRQNTAGKNPDNMGRLEL